MKKTSIAILVVLALLIGLVSGFYLASMARGISNVCQAPASKVSGNGTFADGWKAAKDKLDSMTGVNVAADNKVVSGVVKEISGSDIIIEAPLRNLLDDEALKTRTVSVSGVKISLKRIKTPEEINMEKKGTNMEMPDLYKEIEVNSLSDIKPGDNVTVRSQEDIYDKPSFKADNVEVVRLADPSMSTNVVVPPVDIDIVSPDME